MPPKGLFISLESIDGVGKTTQIEMLEKRLQSAGYIVYRTKEPGDAWYGSAVARGVRHLLFTDPTTHNMRPGVADMLLLADHTQNSGDIQDAVNEGKIVISDRYADSQFAYAAVTSRNCPQWALDVYSSQFGFVPDMTILLLARGPQTAVPFPPPTRGMKIVEDISWALERANSRKGHEAGKQDGKAWNDVEDQRRIQDAYIAQLQGQERAVLVDVWQDSTKEEIADLIWQCVSCRLPVIEQEQTKAA